MTWIEFIPRLRSVSLCATHSGNHNNNNNMLKLYYVPFMHVFVHKHVWYVYSMRIFAITGEPFDRTTLIRTVDWKQATDLIEKYYLKHIRNRAVIVIKMTLFSLIPYYYFIKQHHNCIDVYFQWQWQRQCQWNCIQLNYWFFNLKFKSKCNQTAETV